MCEYKVPENRPLTLGHNLAVKGRFVQTKLCGEHIGNASTRKCGGWNCAPRGRPVALIETGWRKLAVSDTVFVVLILLFLFQIKHMLADYFLQTERMLVGRDQYFHLGRMQHALVHALGSAIVFAMVLTQPAFILITVLIEAVVHFHIDWGKARYSDKAGYTPADAGFWRAAGVDQALHQMTYVGMLAAWVLYTAPDTG
ncbi:hypothetical protein C1J05_12245 [Sulfitobacter sp. JL08]|nr:hypothetical protein C1J05_12245 [Sulfitobacter sp. JL08]